MNSSLERKKERKKEREKERKKEGKKEREIEREKEIEKERKNEKKKERTSHASMPDSTSMARSKSRSGLEYFIEHVVLYDSRSESIPKGMLEHRPHCLDAGGLICHQNPFFGQRPRREPEGMKSCRIQGESVRPSVSPSVRTSPPRPFRGMAQATQSWSYQLRASH